MATILQEDILETMMKNGNMIDIPIHHRFLLHDPDHLLYIESGSIDLFGLKPSGDFTDIAAELIPILSATTQPFMGDILEGSLFFLEGISEKRVLFPFNLNLDYPFAIIAIATTAIKLRKIPVEAWQNLLSNSPPLQKLFSIQMGKWARDFFHLLREEEAPNPAYFHKLEIDKKIKLQESEIVLIERSRRVETYWLHVISGSCCIGNKKNLELNAPLYFPFYPPCDFQFLTDGEIVLVKNPPLETHELWLNGLKFFNDQVLEQLQTYELRKEILAEMQVEERQKNTNALFKNAFRRLKNVLGRSKISEVSALDDPIFAAINHIGSLLRIRFQRGPYSKLESPNLIIKKICQTSNIRYRQVHLIGKWWQEETLPLLVFDKNTNAPAVVQFSHSRCHIYDPLTGDNKIIDSSIASEISSEAFLFYRSFPASKELSWRKMLEFAFFGRLTDFTSLMCFGFFGILFGLFFPYAYFVIFDAVIPNLDKIMLLQVIMGLGVATLSGALFSLSTSYVSLRMEGLISHDMQTALWDRLLNLPAKFFRSYQVGDLIQRVSGIDTMRQILSNALISTIINGVFSFVYLAAMFYYSVKLSFVGLLIIGIGILISIAGSIMMYYLNTAASALSATNGSRLLQFLFGISKIRTSAAEKRMFAYWIQDFVNTSQLTYRAGLLSGGMNVVSSSFGILSIFAIYLTVTSMLESSSPGASSGNTAAVFYSINSATSILESGAPKAAPAITPGIFFAFTSAFGSFSAAVYGLIGVASSLVALIPLWKRTKPVRTTPMELGFERIKAGTLKGRMYADHLYFRYGPDEPFVVNDISIKANEGEFIAIVGPSGCGKSTLLKLLIGFEDPEKGAVFFDGRNLASLDLQDLRRQMGIVHQGSSILEGTIKDNISANGEYTDEEVMKVIKLAGLENDLNQMPQGLSTMLATGGDSLAGGQKQRLIIARSIIGHPKILFYDEATSQLDNETQAVIAQSIWELKATRVIVAHRLNTIINADRIYVMKQGQIIETGTYDELIRSQGFFAELAHKQLL